MGARLNRRFDLTGEDYAAGPRKTELNITDVDIFESKFNEESIIVEFTEPDTDRTYSEIFAVKKHPDAKINGLLRAAFDSTDVSFKLKDLLHKSIKGYVYTKGSGYKGVKFESDGPEY